MNRSATPLPIADVAWARAEPVGRPRLRLTEDDGSDAYRRVHGGAPAFAEGFFAAVRNPNGHADGLPVPPEHEAPEQPAALGVLARRVDAATVVTA